MKLDSEVAANWSAEAIGYCNRNGVASFVEEAAAIAKSCFSALQSMAILLQADPDSGDVSVVIQVTIGTESKTLLSDLRKCAARWHQVLPDKASSLISLTYRLP